jgi:hypothetical protein
VNNPKQLKLPLRDPAPKVTLQDALDSIDRRQTRIESRLVQLMKHVGMKDDGRGNPLPADHPKEVAA